MGVLGTAEKKNKTKLGFFLFFFFLSKIGQVLNSFLSPCQGLFEL